MFIFVFLFLQAGSSLMRMNRFNKAVLSLEKKLQIGSKERNLSKYNEEMKAEITQYLNKLKAIDSVLSRSLDPAQLLQRISKALPKGSYIDDFNLDNDKKILDFNIVSPVSASGETMDISELIALWKMDKALMSAIENIASSHSERQKNDQELVLISKFSCIISQGGS
jgi:glucosamine 6-phosphate synthetase-like amidotransferase/phosphosugar isomerase protein